ncbi:protease PrsW [Paraliobacillus ryukyuensis]|uniref:Protease PrsW n=1 Tax=Paraliobacillus ryukyuensis TaxID=200904 RepID=A0A366EGK2_9BACI|nr:glutamic-type intramembrane protease PrsW [Paraliobacillus ryukyuensis]RBP01514.1 RsiW-degrading membrane proteinase PrsW (M82 family) [Paraliobacillus ryukyuensis]
MIALLSAGIAPALALMTFFYLKDRFNSEPLLPIVRSFINGALLVFPIMFVQYAFVAENVAQDPLISSFLLTGLMEEFFKWFIFIFTVYKFADFDTPYDGIIYGVAISLGFATVENILYLFAHGIEYAFSRAVFPVSSHALFGVIMGYYLGKAKFKTTQPKRTMSIGLVLPFLLHGTYDYILQTSERNWIFILIPFMVILWLNAIKKVKQANQSMEQCHVPVKEVK